MLHKRMGISVRFIPRLNTCCLLSDRGLVCRWLIFTAWSFHWWLPMLDVFPYTSLLVLISLWATVRLPRPPSKCPFHIRHKLAKAPNEISLSGFTKTDFYKDFQWGIFESNMYYFPNDVFFCVYTSAQPRQIGIWVECNRLIVRS